MTSARHRLMTAFHIARLMRHMMTASGRARERLILARHYWAAHLFEPHPDETHLRAAMEWLCRAQDVTGDQRGVSAMFHLGTGWGMPYPETSGYIIATFLAYADLTGDRSFIQRAVRIGDWEIDIQTPGGGVLSNPKTPFTRVFNTGQVILGWCTLYERTGEPKYLEAARRSGEYLIRAQEPSGTWVKDTYCGSRTYHARTDWGLSQLAHLTGDGRFLDAAQRNLLWVMRQQRENGWFAECGFHDALPITHVIAYTLRGLLQCYLLGTEEIGGLRVLAVVRQAADAICTAVMNQPVRGLRGMAPSAFDAEWRGTPDNSCLTGNAQLACLLFLLARVVKEQRYQNVASMLVDATKRAQNIAIHWADVRGAVPGSHPFHEGYCPNLYPNWAAKFLADALMMKLDSTGTLLVPA